MIEPDEVYFKLNKFSKFIDYCDLVCNLKLATQIFLSTHFQNDPLTVVFLLTGSIVYH